MTVLRRYADVLAAPHVTPALLASLVGRLSLGMTGLALLLLVRDATGSYARAGAVSAAYAVAFAIGSPSRARAADRTGPARVLVACSVLHPLAFAGLVVLAGVGAATPLLALAAVLVGVTVPPVGSVMRALWSAAVAPAQLAAAFSLESVVVELCFVVGPLLVAGLSLLDPAAPAVVSAAVATAGGALLAANPLVRAVVPHPDRSSSLAGPLVSPVVRSCLLTVLWIGAGFGTIEVGVLAFVDEQGGGGATTGVVLAVWSVGSILGGLLYGGLSPTRPAVQQLPLLVVLVAVGACLPVLAPGVVLLALLLMLSGSTIAPFSSCNSLVLGAGAPPGTVTEAFAWNGSMIFGGAALGTAVAGVLVEQQGARAALVLTAVTGLLTLTSVLTGRGARASLGAPSPA